MTRDPADLLTAPTAVSPIDAALGSFAHTAGFRMPPPACPPPVPACILTLLRDWHRECDVRGELSAAARIRKALVHAGARDEASALLATLGRDAGEGEV